MSNDACISSLAHPAHDNLQSQQASWRSTTVSAAQLSAGVSARVHHTQRMRGCAMSCFQASWLSPGVPPADATSLDFTPGARSSATQRAPELFRVSLSASHWTTGERFAAVIRSMGDASHAWSCWTSRPSPVFQVLHMPHQ